MVNHPDSRKACLNHLKRHSLEMPRSVPHVCGPPAVMQGALLSSWRLHQPGWRLECLWPLNVAGLLGICRLRSGRALSSCGLILELLQQVARQTHVSSDHESRVLFLYLQHYLRSVIVEALAQCQNAMPAESLHEKKNVS